MIGGRIIAVDVGRRCGVAKGAPGSTPTAIAVMLSARGASLGLQAANLIAFLDREFRQDKPALVAKEAPFSLAAFRDHHVNEAAVRSAFGLHTVIEGLCQRYGIACHTIAEISITKHFTGKARHGGRAKRKAAIIRRCQLLGYLPRDSRDEDRADALAVWDFASARLAHVPPKELHFFDEVVA